MTKFLGEEGTKEVLSLIKELIKILLETKEDILQDPYQHFAVLNKEANTGDAVFYDSTTGKKVIVNPDKINSTDYPASRYTPIGVIVIPSSHDVYGTGESAMVSLNYMNYSTPDSGSTSSQSIYWGYNSLLLGDAITGSVYCGTTASPTTDITGVTTGNKYLPSDAFSSVQCPTDPTAYYYSSSSSYYAVPSPYLENGSRNPNYYSTESPSSTNNGQADFDGVGKTQLMLNAVTVSDWQTSSTITNSYSSGNYPSACCCWRYHTDGTSQGDWYLPALGEISYIMVRLKKINNTISTLNSIYSVGSTISTSNYFWSSTEYNSAGARGLGTGYGNVSNNLKDSSNYVRAFCRVQP